MLIEAKEIGVLKIRRYGKRARGRLIAQHTHMNAVTAARCAADQKL
jgi:hypothetical protein